MKKDSSVYWDINLLSQFTPVNRLLQNASDHPEWMTQFVNVAHKSNFNLHPQRKARIVFYLLFQRRHERKMRCWWKKCAADVSINLRRRNVHFLLFAPAAATRKCKHWVHIYRCIWFFDDRLSPIWLSDKLINWFSICLYWLFFLRLETRD